jgi:hypothetical protein
MEAPANEAATVKELIRDVEMIMSYAIEAKAVIECQH